MMTQWLNKFLNWPKFILLLHVTNTYLILKQIDSLSYPAQLFVCKHIMCSEYNAYTHN